MKNIYEHLVHVSHIFRERCNTCFVIGVYQDDEAILVLINTYKDRDIRRKDSGTRNKVSIPIHTFIRLFKSYGYGVPKCTMLPL